MEREDTLKRTLSLESLDSDPGDGHGKLSRKKTILMKEYPLTRQGSSADSQYIVLSQDDEVVDQSTLDYKMEDFLTDEDNDDEDNEDNDDEDKDNEAEEEDGDLNKDDQDKSSKGDDNDKSSKDNGNHKSSNCHNNRPPKDNEDKPPKDEGNGKSFDNQDDQNDDLSNKSFDNQDDRNGNLSNTEEMPKDDDDTDVDWDTEINGENTTDLSESNPSSKTQQESSKESKTDTPSLSKIESCYRDAKIINTIVSASVVKIYDKLVEKRSNPNRMDIVTAILLDEPDSTTSDELARDIRTVIKSVQEKTTEELNEDYISTLLRLNEKMKNRVDIVIQQLLVSLRESDNSPRKDDVKADFKPQLKKLDTESDDPLVKNDPIYQDMRVISKMFPEKDRNEIYAYLEAHHNKKDRIQVVIDELLRSSNSQDPFDEIDSTITRPANPLTNRSHGEFENLCEIFPDCDPNYIFEQLEENAKDENRMNKIAAKMFETRNYPKLKDVLEKQSEYANKKKIRDMKFELKEFISKFPDPKTMFELNDRAMSACYKGHVLAHIKNEFAQFKDGYIKEVLERNDHSLFRSQRELNEELATLTANNRQSKKLRSHPRVTQLPYPDELDEFFFNELLYMNHELEIKMHLKEIEDQKKTKIEEARNKGELYECGCCFDDEVLFEEMAACADGHLFCKECVRRSTEAAFGDAKIKFPCLTGTCEHDIPLSVLQSIVPPNLFSNIVKKLQEEEVRLADIPDLVSCPFCSFATVMPNPDDKVFKCLNPECLKESCRLCQELNHVPLKCSEVEKKSETDMRTYIESKISEAMLRTCPGCNKRFFKDFGCNKMTCICGTTMCYVCREPNIDYDHFNNNGGCSNTDDAQVIHKREMEEAAVKARETYLQDHPEAADTEMKYDPQKLVDEMMNTTGNGFYDDDDDRSGDEGSDYDDDDYY